MYGGQHKLADLVPVDLTANAMIAIAWHNATHRFMRRLHCNTGPCAPAISVIYTVSQQKNCATFIFTVTLANVGRFFKFFQCRNQKEMAHNKNEKFPTVA